MKKIKNIVILGGGSAGWMVASTLINELSDISITVVESDKVANIGVGESTTREIQHWIARLGIDVEDFMKETEAVYKLGVKFTNFYLKDEKSFFTHFGSPDLRRTVNGYLDWQIKKIENKNIDGDDYFKTYIPQSVLMLNNKFTDKNIEELYPFQLNKDSAFQVNAVKLGKYLAEKYAMPKGVKRIIGTVVGINGDEYGINSLTLEDGQEIKADFFVDCTGFKSMLLGDYLGGNFISTKKLLPHNKAFFAPVSYTDKEKELENFTHSIALDNGWAWNTPLWSRIGTGYVYSDEFTDEDSALQEFKNHLDSKNMAVYNPNRSKEMEINKLYIKNGYYEKPWIKNVCAIGLSAGFLDPLEGTGLLFIHNSSLSLANILSKGFYNGIEVEVFNKNYNEESSSAMSFIRLHFILSQRKDSEYWQKMTSQENVLQNIDFLEKIIYGSGFNSGINSITNPALVALIAGMNFNLFNNFKIGTNFYNNFVEINPNYSFTIKEQENVKLIWDTATKFLQSQYSWLSNNVYKEKK